MANETATVESKFDKFLNRVTDSLDTWLEEFERNPIRTAVKVVILLWLIREGYALWKSTTLPNAANRGYR